MSSLFAREHVTEALRFWEVGRVTYNVALLVVSGAVLVVAGYQWADWPWLTPWLLVLGLIANLLYCFAYPVDLLVQASAFRALWRTLRYGLWLVGTMIACFLAAMVLGGFYFLGAF